MTLCMLVITLGGCSKSQKAVKVDTKEERIYLNFEQQVEDLKIESPEMLSSKKIKALYKKYAHYEIEEDLAIEIINQEDGYIVDASPIQSGVKINSTYVLQVSEGYLSALSTNPGQYKVPDSLDIDQLLNQEDQEKLVNKLKKKASKNGKITDISTTLCFDVHEYGIVIFYINIDVDTPDYSYVEEAFYDGISGKILR